MSNESKVPRIITADEIRVGQKIAVDRFLRRGDTLGAYMAHPEDGTPEVESKVGTVQRVGDRYVRLRDEDGEWEVPVRFGPEHARVLAAEITLLEEPEPVYDPELHVFIDKTTAYAASNTYAQHVANDGYRYAADLTRAVAKAYKEQVGD